MLTAKQVDACCGTALLYMGPDGAADYYILRLRSAMDRGDKIEAEHVSAVMVGLLVTRAPEVAAQAAEIWHDAFVAGIESGAADVSF